MCPFVHISIGNIDISYLLAGKDMSVLGGTKPVPSQSVMHLSKPTCENGLAQGCCVCV